MSRQFYHHCKYDKTYVPFLYKVQAQQSFYHLSTNTAEVLIWGIETNLNIVIVGGCTTRDGENGIFKNAIVSFDTFLHSAMPADSQITLQKCTMSQMPTTIFTWDFGQELSICKVLKAAMIGSIFDFTHNTMRTTCLVKR